MKKIIPHKKSTRSYYNHNITTTYVIANISISVIKFYLCCITYFNTISYQKKLLKLISFSAPNNNDVEIISASQINIL